METSARTPVPPHPPPQSPFTVNRARDISYSQPQPQSYSTSIMPTTVVTPGPTLETAIKKADVSPRYSLFPSLIHIKTFPSMAPASSQSLRSTILDISPTTTNISSVAVEVSLPTRRRAREIEIFGKRPFEFRFSRHRISNSEKERKKRSKTGLNDTKPEEGLTAPITPTPTIFPKPTGTGEPEKFSFEFDKGEIDLTFPFNKSKGAFSAPRTSISSSGYSPTPSPQRQSQEDEDLGFPFGRPLHHTCTRGRGLGSVDSEMPLSLITTQQAQIQDPHPGTLVTFSSNTEPSFVSSKESGEWSSATNYLSSAEVRPKRKNTWNTRILAGAEYHRALRYLALSSRVSYTSPSSSPTIPSSPNSPPSPISPQLNMSQDSISESAPVPGSGIDSTNPTTPIHAPSSPPTKIPRENVDYQARKLERRAWSLQKRDILLRYGSSLPSSIDTQSMCPRQHDEAAQDAEPSSNHTSPMCSKHSPGSVHSTHSSSSTSSTSVSVFLSSVRASFEARQSRELCPSVRLSEAKGSTEGVDSDVLGASCQTKTMSYDIFVDEQQRGFLDDWLAI